MLFKRRFDGKVLGMLHGILQRPDPTGGTAALLGLRRRRVSFLLQEKFRLPNRQPS